MNTHILRGSWLRYPDAARDPAAWLGVILGLVMPLASAWIFPSYRHDLPDALAENLKLLEAPFVVCELLMVVWAIHRGMNLRRVAQSLPRDCVVAFAIMIVGVWASSFFVSKAVELSVMISASTMVHLLFAAAVAQLMKAHDCHSIERFSIGLAVGLVAILLMTVWRLALPPPLSDLPGNIIEWGFALPGFINVRYFGEWTGAIAALFAAMILNKEGDDRGSWHDAAFFLAAEMTIWSGTRSAVLGIALGCAVMLISQWRLPSRRVFVRLSLLTLAALAINEWMLPHPDPTFMLFHSMEGDSMDQFASGRLTIWVLSYEKWLQAPWFGWGSGSTFWEVHFPGWSHTQPHNFVLQFLLTWGVVGACGALWLLARATVTVHRLALGNPRVWPLNVSLYSLLVVASLDGALHYPRFVMMIMALFGMIIIIGREPASGRGRTAG